MSTQYDDKNETVADVRRAWEHGRAFDGPICGSEATHYIDPTHLADARALWKERVDALLDSPLGDLVPTGDRVIAVLGSDHLGTFMGEIESARCVTLAIEGAFQLDANRNPVHSHELTLVRLSPSPEDPFDWIEDDNFMGCEFDYDWLMLQVALSALGLCRQCFWASETDQPAAWSIEVLWPARIDEQSATTAVPERTSGAVG